MEHLRNAITLPYLSGGGIGFRKCGVGLSDPIIFKVGALYGESGLLFRPLFPSSTIFLLSRILIHFKS